MELISCLDNPEITISDSFISVLLRAEIHMSLNQGTNALDIYVKKSIEFQPSTEFYVFNTFSDSMSSMA